jgi:outer membrane protein assembly factor BamC
MAQRSNATRGLLYAVALTSLAGCGSFSLSDAGKIDYKSAGKVAIKSLEVPPDLTQLKRDNRYTVQEANANVATVSSFNLGAKDPAAKVAVSNGAAPIAPAVIADMRIVRDGNQRYLVIKQTPEVLWPQLKDFWQELGFLINVDRPEAGVMETDWAENRAKIPQDILRNAIGKVFDGLYSTSERDKFRTRVERAPDGTTEIYISHRGAEEVLTGLQKDTTAWTVRPSDPELEAEFLARLMTRLGSDATVAHDAVGKAVAGPAKAKLVKSPDGSSVEVNEEFDRAWRRVGLALDRVGFTVEDRDRTVGLYFVRYVDDASSAAAGKGLFSSAEDAIAKAAKYRISVKGSGNTSKITVQNEAGKTETSEAADKILSLLNDQLK